MSTKRTKTKGFTEAELRKRLEFALAQATAELRELRNRDQRFRVDVWEEDGTNLRRVAYDIPAALARPFAPSVAWEEFPQATAWRIATDHVRQIIDEVYRQHADRRHADELSKGTRDGYLLAIAENPGLPLENPRFLAGLRALVHYEPPKPKPADTDWRHQAIMDCMAQRAMERARKEART